MIKLPDFKKTFEYENDFYLSCDVTRIGKILSHYELYKIVNDIPGAIVECGVFKGNSLTRFAMLRDLFGNTYSKKIIGFDTFEKFPKTKFTDDLRFRTKLIDDAGEQSISKEQLMKVLKHKGVDKNVDLVKGDITKTLPNYVNSHPGLKISLLNVDVDIYEPVVTILKHLYPKVTKGGIVILDDYGIFPGETKAVEEYFKNKDVEIKKFSFSMTPSYIIKKEM